MRTVRGSSRPRGGGLPQCMLGHTSPGCWPGDPPGVGLETPLGCGPGDPPARPLNFPPGCGPRDFPPGDLQGMLGYHP